MSYGTHTPDAQEKMARIVKYLKKQRPATSKQLSEKLDIHKTRTPTLLNELRNEGKIKNDGARPANWSIGCDKEHVEKHCTGIQPARKIVASWAKDHPAPHDVLAHLFGMAGARVACG